MCMVSCLPPKVCHRSCVSPPLHDLCCLFLLPLVLSRSAARKLAFPSDSWGFEAEQSIYGEGSSAQNRRKPEFPRALAHRRVCTGNVSRAVIKNRAGTRTPDVRQAFSWALLEEGCDFQIKTRRLF